MKAYQIRVSLVDLPTIWRGMIIPSKITFHQLHLIIQHAMGWDDMHLYEFRDEQAPASYTDDQEMIDIMNITSKMPKNPTIDGPKGS